MRRTRKTPAYDPSMISELKKIVKPTLAYTWTKWMTVGQVASRMGIDIEEVMMLVRESKDLAIHKGWRIKKAGEEEPSWVPISPDPADFLIKTRSM